MTCLIDTNRPASATSCHVAEDGHNKRTEVHTVHGVLAVRIEVGFDLITVDRLAFGFCIYNDYVIIYRYLFFIFNLFIFIQCIDAVG